MVAKTIAPIVFLGTEDFSAAILKALINSDFTVEAVITKPDAKVGRGRKLSPTKVKKLALEHEITIFEVKNKDDIRQAIRQTSQKTGVLASFGKIIPEDVITAFKNGIINVHPSLLPQYRGPSPIESAILNGDRTTGVSIMLLANEVDAGDVFSQEALELTGKETASELYNTLADIGSKLLINTLAEVENGLTAKPQNHSSASFCQMIKKDDAILLPEAESAELLDRKIRAFYSWPKAKIKLGGREVIVLEASVGKSPNSLINFLCADGKYLNIERLMSPHGKSTTAKQYYNSFLAK